LRFKLREMAMILDVYVRSITVHKTTLTQRNGTNLHKI